MSKPMNDVLALLERSLDVIQHDIDEIGGCDHSVGICCCELIHLADDIRAMLDADRKRRSELMREAAMHLTNWLDMVECDCEGIGHQCGRTQVKSCRDRLLAALEQEGEQ